MSCTIEAKNISYSIGQRVLFDGVTFSLLHKEKIVIKGSNGCGKSTLLKILAGLKEPKSGEIHLFHEAMGSLKSFDRYRRDIGFLFQDSDDQFLAPSVLEDVAFGLLNIGVDESEARSRALDILERFEIVHLKDSVPLKLSGGQKKLVALAGVLVMEPKLLFLDEPSNGLDEWSLAELLKIIKDTHSTTIIVSHDKEFIEQLGFRTLNLTTNGLL